ncbi:MAG: flagellar hook-associated protein FlgK [Magnetococcales bacterium]|nr:flagellar hook-associated protein FlgK [Magnetococcales bacterium]MBF0438443.1 flagellar hook-associated protein FlgK [Magnetococcales bacterium]
MSLVNLLNISKLGIFASQGTLQTISHNITNANTPGYSRQSVQLESAPGGQSFAGGAGVRIADVRSQMDQLVDRRMELGTGELGRLEIRDKYLNLVENVFNELDGDGLSKRMDALYDASDTLADNPGNAVARHQVVAKADDVAKQMNKMHGDLSELALPLDKEVGVILADVNTRLKALQQINNVIVRNENTNPAIDLKDQRRNMILELGKIIDIRTLDRENGDIQIMTSRGQELLADAAFSATLSRSASVTETGFQGIKIGDQELGAEKIQGGQLGGLLELRDQIIYGKDGYLTRMETLADEIRFQFNKVNSQSVGKKLVSSITGAMKLGSDLNTKIADLVTDTTSPDYKKSPVDLSRVTDGKIFFAVGDREESLTPTQGVEITKEMSLVQVQQAIDALDGVKAEITSENQLKISNEKTGAKLAVISDQTGLLAALGVGALFGGKGMADMGVNPTLVQDPDLVGVGRLIVDSLTAPTTVAFDNANSQGALALGNLRTTKFDLFDNTSTFTGHYAALVGELGSTVNQNTESLKAQESAQTFIAGVRESISGVSLEEELTDLIRFQRAFQSSSKMVGVADELMQTIIQMV